MDCGVPFCHTGDADRRHGLGLPDQQPDPRVERPGLPRPVAGGPRAAAQDQQLPRVHRPRLPRAVRGLVRAGHQRAAGHDQEHRVRSSTGASRKAGCVPQPPAVRTGKKVAVVGSGPAGLAAAAQLNRAGHLVTVFERADRIGGLLMYGIPNMKLDKSVVQRRVDLMEAEGVEFVTSCEVGKDYPAREAARGLRRRRPVRRGDAAARLLRRCRGPRAQGHPLRDGVPARATPRACSTATCQDGQYISAKDKDVIVIGGGDTGTDCVGTSLRHGCRSLAAARDRAQAAAGARRRTTPGRSGRRSTSSTTARRRRRRSSAPTRASTASRRSTSSATRTGSVKELAHRPRRVGQGQRPLRR